MTRGKYAVRAARRREDQSVQSEIDACQRQVRQLTGQVGELTAALDAERAGRKADARHLQAQLEELISPELAATREELERQRQRAGKSEAAQRHMRQIHTLWFVKLADVLEETIGLSMAETWELMLSLDPEAAQVFGDDEVIVGEGTGVRENSRLTPDRARALQVARGYRSRTDAVAILRDRMINRGTRQ
jgi:hypothetical protein